MLIILRSQRFVIESRGIVWLLAFYERYTMCFRPIQPFVGPMRAVKLERSNSKDVSFKGWNWSRRHWIDKLKNNSQLIYRIYRLSSTVVERFKQLKHQICLIKLLRFYKLPVLLFQNVFKILCSSFGLKRVNRPGPINTIVLAALKILVAIWHFIRTKSTKLLMITYILSLECFEEV